MKKQTQSLVKCETHLHSLGGSSCAHVSPADIAKVYSNAGYGAIVVTNHYTKDIFESYPGGTVKEKSEYYINLYKAVQEECAKYNIQVFLGAELRPFRPQEKGSVDILLYGVAEDFLYEHPHIYDYSDEDIYRTAHSAGILCYQAHPLRSYCYLHNINYLDGIEVYNGSPNHEPHIKRTQEYAIEHDKLRISGSDFHNIFPQNPLRTINGGIMMPVSITSSTQLVEYLKQNPPLIIPTQDKQN